MLPDTVLSIRRLWFKGLFDLTLFHAAIFCGVVLLFSHWITIRTCFLATLCMEIVSLLLLVLLRASQPENGDLKSFCERSSRRNQTDDKRASGYVGSSRKWEFVRKAGGGHDVPENTLAAIMQSKQYNVAGIVADLRVTSDGVIILCHDDNVIRTTDGTGLVDEMTYEQVKELNAAAKFTSTDGMSFGHEPIPSLEEAVQISCTLDLSMVMELRDTSNKMVYSLLMVFQKYPWLYEKAVVCSFMPFVLYKIRKYDSHIMTGLKTRKNYLEWKYIDPQDPSWWTWAMVIGDMALTWSVYAWMWYFCGTSYVLLYKDTISR